MANVQPNQFVMTHGETKVSYITDGFHGEPTLSYTHGTLVMNFSGPQIRVAATEIGNLVTVTIRMSVDTGSTSFSVLIPVIELPDSHATQTFETAGISTVHKGPDSFPSTGLRETYQIHTMHGTARVVLVPLAVPATAATSGAAS